MSTVRRAAAQEQGGFAALPRLYKPCLQGLPSNRVARLRQLTAHLPEMLRLQQRGENIYYTPLSKKKHHILIDDMTAEGLERFKKDGFMPAVVLESSPGNYQCLLTITKLHSGFDRDVGNRLTERLNRLYGDKNLSGCIHPHRAPGFENRKPKHRRQDGGFP